MRNGDRNALQIKCWIPALSPPHLQDYDLVEKYAHHPTVD